MRNSGVVDQRHALRIPPRSKTERPVFFVQKHKRAVRLRKLQSRIQQSYENFVQNPGTIQLAGSFQKNRELLHVIDVGDMHAGKLVEKLARRTNHAKPRLENRVN